MRSTWPAALLVLALLTGCGSNSNGSPQAGPPAPGPANTTTSSAGKASGVVQCPENSVITDTLGISVTSTDPEAARSGDKTVVCHYDGTKAGGSRTGVTLRLQTDATHSTYTNFEGTTIGQKYTPTDRSGVGDEAFTYIIVNGSDPLNGLVARKGGVFVFVSGQVSFDQLIALFNRIASA